MANLPAPRVVALGATGRLDAQRASRCGEPGRAVGGVTDDSLQHCWQNVKNTTKPEEWSGWASRGSPEQKGIRGAPSVSRNKNGTLEVFTMWNGPGLAHIW